MQHLGELLIIYIIIIFIFIYFLARTDMITIQAMAWNQRKIRKLAKALSLRFKKVYF